MPRTTLILDSSQITSLNECEERWRLVHHEQLIKINEFNPEETGRPSDAITSGTLIHKLLELYYKEIGEFRGQTEGLRKALEFNPDTVDEVDKHQYPLDPKIRAQVYKRFKDYLMFWGQRDYDVSIQYKPVIDVHPVTGLLCDRRVPVALVEQGFSFPLLDTREYLFILEGRIDFIGSCQGQPLWMDHKSQQRAHDLYKKSIQFRNYALVTGFDLGVINYIRLTEKLDKTTLVRQPISFSPHEMIAWKQELTEFYIKIANKIRRGELERRRSSCGSGYGECMFTAICDECVPVMREQIKKTQYTHRHEWKPW